MPVVFIDVHTPRRSRACPGSLGDDVAGGAQAARHLLDLGHRDIAFIGDAVENPFGFTSSRDRQLGVADELAPGGIELPPDRVGLGAHGRYEARELAHGCWPATTGRRRSSPPATRRRSGVVAAARELGLHVPDDLSVVGYDDIEAADYVGLTTVRQQLFESGRRGPRCCCRDRRTVR